MSNSTTAQQTRDRVLQLAREIEELSRASVPPQTFFQQFLDLLVRALGARAGAVWSLAGGRLNLVTEIGLADIGFKDNPQAHALNQRLLSDVMADGQARTCSPDDTDVQLPTPNLVILSALHSNKESVGVVEIFQRPDAPTEALPGFLQFVEQMTGYASRYLEQQREGKSADRSAQFWDDFEQFVLQMQRSLDVKEVTSTAVNDGRLLLGCDRVSVAVKRGKKISIQAVSGEDVVNARSNLIRSMAKLAKKTMAMRERVSYTGKVQDLAPQIEEPLANFIQESGSRMVIAVPLFESEPIVESDEKAQERKKVEDRRKTIGCLFIEQVSESHPQPGLVDRIDLVVDHVAAALHNAQTHQRLFLLWLWKFLGACLEWFHGRKLAKTLGVLAIVSAIVGTMVYLPWDYRVEGEGRLMPVVQQEVFAPWDGEVIEVLTEGGLRVEKGQPLVKLRNDQLEAELVGAKTELNEKKKLWLTLKAQRDDLARNGGSREDQIRLQGRMVETDIEIKGLEEQRKILEQRRDLLIVRAPIDGVVATFQVDQLLKHRPVRRGEILLEVMDDSGDWWLELEVEEHRMGHILRAQHNLNKQNLPVEFILATKSESTFTGELRELGTRVDKNPELGSVVPALVSVNVAELPDCRIGAEVRAKISCEKRSLGYVLFGDVVEFCQKYFWL